MAATAQSPYRCSLCPHAAHVNHWNLPESWAASDLNLFWHHFNESNATVDSPIQLHPWDLMKDLRDHEVVILGWKAAIPYVAEHSLEKIRNIVYRLWAPQQTMYTKFNIFLDVRLNREGILENGFVIFKKVSFATFAHRMMLLQHTHAPNTHKRSPEGDPQVVPGTNLESIT